MKLRDEDGADAHDVALDRSEDCWLEATARGWPRATNDERDSDLCETCQDLGAFICAYCDGYFCGDHVDDHGSWCRIETATDAAADAACDDENEGNG